MRWLVLLLLLPLPALAQTWTGVPEIVDGDTVKIDGVRLRLNNMDAPESAQTCQRDQREYRCGDAATAYLKELVANRTVTCTGIGADIYRRPLVICRVGMVDLGQAMVRAGWALAEFDVRDYGADQDYARANRVGMWAGTFERPRDWRKSYPR